jgi:hypothetical protein
MKFGHIRPPLRAEALPAGEFMLFSEPTPSLPASTSNGLLLCSAAGLGARAPFFMFNDHVMFNDHFIPTNTHEIHSQGGETLSIIR